ncbi:MAG: hypothetical protein ACTS2F_02810 [Thainema sp.]
MTPAIASTVFRKSAVTKQRSFARLWARKYVIAVSKGDNAANIASTKTLAEATSRLGRAETAAHLKKHLRLASAQAWTATENLLSHEVLRHRINPDLINPVEIAADSRELFEQALDAYENRITPHRMSVGMSNACGKMRAKYTADDPRAIGFVSMQFHYTGMKLLEYLTPVEKSLFEPYLKVMDDHMYMPLRAAYEAAADYEMDAPELKAVQNLLPLITPVAKTICDRVRRLYPGYETYSGALDSRVVNISSIRDAEMFQVYLCLCVLQNSFVSVQQELFPLCVMLYPSLKVKWSLVQEMLRLLGQEMLVQLDPEDMAVFLPHLRTLTEMFADDVFDIA